MKEEGEGKNENQLNITSRSNHESVSENDIEMNRNIMTFMSDPYFFGFFLLVH